MSVVKLSLAKELSCNEFQSISFFFMLALLYMSYPREHTTKVKVKVIWGGVNLADTAHSE